MSYLELLRLAAPETIIVLAALAVLAADVLALCELETRFRWIISGLIACVGCVASIGWMLALPQNANVLSGMFVLDPVGQLVKVGLLVLTIFTVLISFENDFSIHPGE